MTGTKQNSENALRAIIHASVQLAGGTANKACVDSLISSYTALDAKLSKEAKKEIKNRHFHSLQHPLEVVMLIEPDLKTIVEELINSDISRSVDEMAEAYASAVKSLPEKRAARAIALGISAPFHDLVYHTDGQIHPDVVKHLLSEILEPDLSWKPNGRNNSPFASAFAKDDQIKLGPTGNERLSMIAAEQFMKKSDLYQPDLFLQVCTDIEATIPFKDTKYQHNFSLRFNELYKRLQIPHQDAREILDASLNLANDADLIAFNADPANILDVTLETKLHTELDHRLALGESATALDAANAFARDYWFLSNVVEKGKGWAFRKVSKEEPFEIQLDEEQERSAKHAAGLKAHLAAARCAASCILICSNMGNAPIKETGHILDTILQMGDRKKTSGKSRTVLADLKKHNDTPNEYSMGNFDKLAELLLQKLPESLLVDFANAISYVVVTDGSQKKVPPEQIKRNLLGSIPLMAQQLMAHHRIDKSFSELIGLSI